MKTQTPPINLTENNLENPAIVANVAFVRLEMLFDDSVFDLGKLLSRRFYD